ncbi:OmpA family protein [Neolewinella agarilytica]|uniref:WD40-like Beta Propeller Repeat n=1 Tax=Neolewinella agarilytica TaxID=478744 RepID=A0A1H9JC86_9BACT|nr:OmpA family protein [Neolewinella agarilytica]SEQ84621.1 WD40-like Beta Propeller Repeat [Neolewinella agarilytica]
MPTIPNYRKLLFLAILCIITVGLSAQSPLDNGNQPREKDPVLRPDGTELFFTRPDFVSNKGTDNAADIWVRPRYADGSWGRVLNPGSPINSFAHDRALAFSPDGNRLAVLRTGASNFVDLLEVSGRNWRILESWPLPQEAALRLDLTFDPNALRLIYSAYATGKLDLFVRDALPNGKWGEAKELRLLNSPDNETSPALASDGRTLYFRREAQWYRQDDLHLGATPVSIPAEIQQFSQLPSGTDPAAEAIVVAQQTGKKEQLLSMSLPVEARLQPSALFRGHLPSPPLPGEATALVALEDGWELRIRPDALQRYALYLRDGEKLVADGSLPSITNTQGGSLAATTDSPVTEVSLERKELEVGIARRQRELQRLDEERRRYEQSLVQPDDELLELRDQYNRVQRPVGDTLPPATSAKGGSTRDRYAEELAELERMKAKFRRQQDEKIRNRNRGSDHRWEEPTRRTTTPVVPTTATRPVSIGEAYTPAPEVDPRQQRAQAYEDSLRLNSTVRSGLYSNQQPRAYEREAWENEVQRGLPRTTPLTPEEVSKLDADYQRKLDEIASLKAELQRLNNAEYKQQQPAASQPQTMNPTWDTKGAPVYTTPAPARQPSTPATYDNRYAPPASQARAPVTYGQPAAGIPAGISFIPNTAYPDGAGYGGLDQLARQIQSSATVLEIRIHTPLEMDRRAAQLLSEERATTIRNYLTEQGVSPRNYKVLGFGNNLTGNGGERVEILR